MAPEALVPRLGDSLIEKGLLQPEGLDQALEFQRQKAELGKPVLIGQALVELGLIDRTSLDEVVTDQILQLQHALQQTNRQLEQRVEQRTADLQRALVKLTELNQLKSNFVSNISHELRTPLTHIKGYLDILSDLSLGPLTPLQSDALQVLKRAEVRLENMIDDLIHFSLAARGELTLRFEAFSIAELVDLSASQSNNKAKLKDILFSISLPKDLSPVIADKEKIGWVINQLLDNAIKFTPTGGTVIIEAFQENGKVSLSIQDNGIGIPPERIAEIFEPFHQLDSSVTRRYSGTGLGLAMVRRILDAHDSRMKVTSTVGKGTRFDFSLPITT
jgi:signal transduction histidine kinase